MATCNICKYAGRPIYKSPCSECKEFSKYEYENKKTNADRIRSMSDEELSAWIASMTTVCECCAEINECESPKCFNKCLDGVEDWREQPPKGESNNE